MGVPAAEATAGWTCSNGLQAVLALQYAVQAAGHSPTQELPATSGTYRQCLSLHRQSSLSAPSLHSASSPASEAEEEGPHRWTLLQLPPSLPQPSQSAAADDHTAALIAAWHWGQGLCCSGHSSTSKLRAGM